MKQCDDCKQDFPDNEITEYTPDLGWAMTRLASGAPVAHFLCPGCLQENKHEFAAYLDERGLSQEQLALAQVFAFQFLSELGWTVEPPKQDTDNCNKAVLLKAAKNFEAACRKPLPNGRLSVIGLRTWSETASNIIDFDILLGKYKTIFATADEIRQGLERSWLKDRTNEDHFGFTPDQLTEVQTAIRIVCDAILKMTSLCPKELLHYIKL